MNTNPAPFDCSRRRIWPHENTLFYYTLMLTAALAFITPFIITFTTMIPCVAAQDAQENASIGSSTTSVTAFARLAASGKLLVPHEFKAANFEETLIPYEVPEAETGQKTYMDYRTITSPSSDQFAIQKTAWTDEQGFRRSGNYYLVAMATYYTPRCGRTFAITLDNGTTIRVKVGDIKADAHTDVKHQHRFGNVLEFIVDTDAIGHWAKVMGDMSYSDGINLKGKITSINEIIRNEE